jgi:DNA-binding IscR family transcriptional regulator
LRLELSSEGRYALRALFYLAWTGERVPAQRISAEAHVPRRLLARILVKLSHEGLVESEQGRNGTGATDRTHHDAPRGRGSRGGTV